MKVKLLIAFCVMQLLLYGCTKKPSFNATTEVGDIYIQASLVHDHPVLAEYKRYIEINNGGKIYMGKDPGGRAYINIFNLKKIVILQTFWNKIVVIDKGSKSYSLEARPLKENELAAFAGKFHFIRPRKYVFSTKQRDPLFEPKVLKGG